MTRAMWIVGTLALAIAAHDAAAQPLRLGPEFQANSYTTDYQLRPAACQAPGGDFVLVWSSTSQDGDGGGVFGQRYASDGTRAGSEFQVNSATTSTINYGVYSEQPPAICCDPNAGFVVVYPAFDYFNPPVGSRGIFGQRYDSAGTPLGTEFQANTYAGASEDQQSIACGADGGFVVAWQSFDSPGGQDGDEGGVFARRYDNTGSPIGDQFQVNTFTVGRQLRPSVCTDPGGGFVVAWTGNGQDDCCTYGSFAQRFDSAGAPVGTEITVNDPAEANEDQRDAKVACGPSGDFVVVWSADGNIFYQDLLARRYDSSGSPLGAQFLVNAFTAGPQGADDGYGPFAVAADGVGDFVVVWNNDSDEGNIDGSYGALAAQKFSSSGSRLGTEFQVNTFTPGWQGGNSSGVALAVGTDGSFVVAWGSDGAYGSFQDGDGFGVFAQRYLGSPSIPPDGINVPVGAGGTVSTDPENDGVSPGDPVETSITSPNAGTVVITESAAPQTPPSGFTALDFEVSIDAPAATVSAPLVLVFTFDDSILPAGVAAADVDVFRDGTPVPDCTGAPSAIPDPCVSARVAIAGGVRVTVLTSNVVTLSAARAVSPRSTPIAWTFAAPPCLSAPRPQCRAAQKSLLIVKNSDDDTKDKLIWKWLKGASTSLQDLEDPTASASYAFCLYAGTTAAVLLNDAVVPADALKWAPSGSTGFKYKDAAGANDGITGIKVKSGAAGKAKALVKGKGGDLDDPVLGNLTLPVTAQLINQQSNVCFEGVFDLPDVIKNEATQFKAKAQ